MLMYVMFDDNENTATMVYASKREVVLRASKDTNIHRFYEWFMSKKYYPLLNDEAWARSMEDTQPIIDLKEVA